MKKENIYYTNKKEVVCDGSNAIENKDNQPVNALGHPKVYLKMAEDKKQITCPYCSKTWVLKESI